jgi:DNA/RNA-binding domain of Phe-tRNA-synthetase-like protein
MDNMIQVKIAKPLKAYLPDFQIGILSFRATPHVNEALDPYILALETKISEQYDLPSVLTIPEIASARKAYKVLGKDPSRYRLAAESLYRRIVKGNSLYRINNLVDLGNVLSLKTARSIAVLDENKIEGDVLIRIGTNEPYEGIGRGKINVENIPVYCDKRGPFGSPTSDTARTMITEETTQIMVFIISFTGHTNLIEDIELAKNLFERFADATDFSVDIVNA